MAHQLCRECHRLVSEAAATCPYCGISQPIAASLRQGRAARFRRAVGLAAGLLVVELVWFRYEILQLAGPPEVTAPVRVDPYPGFRPLGQGVWLGAQLYDRRDRAYVGRITSLYCPEVTPAGRAWTCVEVESADGHRGWVRSDADAPRLLARMRP
jgi:hypothetical protein